ncbi:MAG: extracellular solute-binding protein [Sporolactobacillus sp.]|jgi:multiple sugar transport system substrate-binding protein|nr:extracellular solute-binding protein [Sporolactobacillus sp.]
MLKKLFMLLMSVLMVLSMAACGNSSSKKSGKDVITVWTYPLYTGDKENNFPGYKDSLKKLIKEFEKKHPNIEIKTQYMSWDEGPKKFSVALNSGNPPDVFFTTSSGMPEYIKSGLALPIDKYLTKYDKKDIQPSALSNWTLSNKIWGVQMWNALYCLGGNVKLLKEKGVDVKKIQDNGWTWDEFYKITSKFKGEKTAAGDKVYGFVTMASDVGDETYAEFLRNNGIVGMVSPKGKFQWQGEKAVEALQFMQKLLDNSVMPKFTAQISQQKMTDMFNAGQAAVFGRIGPYQVPQNDLRNKQIDSGKVKGPKLDLALLPFPHNKGEKEATIGGGGGYALFRQKSYKGSEHTKHAAMVMKWLTGTKASSAAAAQAISPARYSGQKMYAKQLQFNTQNGKFELNYLKKVILTPKISSSLAQIQSDIDTNAVLPKYQAFLAGETNAKKAVDEWTKLANQKLQNK